ncbi:hypothetical protein HG531_012758 [Fusarium graminearum]|nr:hypothetical protein HG531_012758 [Fusarium graminearum]
MQSNFDIYRLLSSELLRNVGLDNGKLLHRLEAILGIFHLIVLLKVLNVFGMCQVLKLGVVVVVLFPVVNLVLVLVVTVVSRTGVQVGECFARVDIVHPFLATDRGIGILVEKS